MSSEMCRFGSTSWEKPQRPDQGRASGDDLVGTQKEHTYRHLSLKGPQSEKDVLEDGIEKNSSPT